MWLFLFPKMDFKFQTLTKTKQNFFSVFIYPNFVANHQNTKPMEFIITIVSEIAFNSENSQNIINSNISVINLM